MKFIKSKLLQESKGRHRGKYLITLEVTDYDLDMLEDMTWTYAPFKYQNNFINGKKKLCDISILDWNDKYKKWTGKVWHCFWQLWKRHDKF